MKKQAVVLVHGIGEQRPMDTVREFVNSVWVKDPDLENTRYWNKPSEISESFEHRRLTTDYAKIKNSEQEQSTSRVDFYEYYWAHHTVDTKMEHLKSWLFSVMLRKPSNFPKPLRPLLYLVWSLIVVILTLAWFITDSQSATDTQGVFSLTDMLVNLIKPVLVVLLTTLLVKIVSYLGDVARYITASPSNIKVRQAIRDGGVNLLKSIAATGNYDRIILVGHSLGSIIAYDVLTQYWAQNNKFKNNQGEALELSTQALGIIEQMENMQHAEETVKYRWLQACLFRQLQQDCQQASGEDVHHAPWLVSDLVTLGSPLTYADFLLFKNSKEFVDRKLDRQYPTLPPVKESGHYTYLTNGKPYLHHGAVFCMVKWTNIYSQPFAILGGDIVSGPVANAFSDPDISVTTEAEKEQRLLPISDIAVDAAYPSLFPRLFTHNNYWRWHRDFDQQLPAHIQILIQTLNLKQSETCNEDSASI